MTASKTFEEHFRRPQNAGVLENADGKAEVENPVCGDILVLYWKMAEGGKVGEIRFQVYGCPAAIAAGSWLTERVSGAMVSELASVDAESISAALGGLSRERYHAAVLATDGLKAMLRELGL